MLTFWLVISAFLYWPFRQWEATYKAPLISALLWPFLILFFIGTLIWQRLSNKEQQQKSVKDTNIAIQDFVKSLSSQIRSYTSTRQETIALAKQFLSIAEMDLKHDYYHAKNLFNTNLREEFDFSIYSVEFNNFYDQQEELGRKHMELRSKINHEDYHPEDYTDPLLDNLDLFELNGLFRGFVNALENPKERFMIQLLIIDQMIQEA
ncbi:MAG: hypothetical protein KDI39_05775 [Pseudomonadales bacterium]|nr:hypothetical protein [Pseudomonadales bacterium]